MNYLYIYDCASGEFHIGQSNPVNIGNSYDANVKIPTMNQGLAGAVVVQNGQCAYYPKCEYTINGKKGTSAFSITPDRGILISSNGGLFQLLFSCTPPEHQHAIYKACNHNEWFYFDAAANAWQGPTSMRKLLAAADSLPATTWVTMKGMQNGVCTLSDFCAMARTQNTPPPIPQQPAMAVAQVPAPQKEMPQVAEETIDEYNGQYLCPVCWLRFDAGDVMSIASHPDLMGDPVLGRHEMKRFFATQFNSRGQALDEKGMPCMHTACPHCRYKLPPRFLEMDSRIFSIIGAPSSGKSYYLASLIHEMTYRVAPEFGIAWRDADPAGNSQLNDVSNRLFTSASPEQAYLSKTDLEGALYENFHRHGRTVKLPKPFIFNASKTRSKTPPISFVFYDNAGEHFEPGRNNEDSPGAMHVAVASGLFFLFDPATSPNFRRIITNKQDPQLHADGRQLDQQAIIMAETESRIASILNIAPGEQLDTPFAIMIGKCDLWEDYLLTPEGGGRPLLPLTAQGKLIKDNVQANSERLRSLLMKMNPAICATAESISSNVCYFAVSQLGVSPETFEDPLTGVTRIGPDPTRINPRYVCEPVLWMMTQIAPDFIQTI